MIGPEGSGTDRIVCSSKIYYGQKMPSKKSYLLHKFTDRKSSFELTTKRPSKKEGLQRKNFIKSI